MMKYSQPVPPEKVDNHNFSIFYAKNKDAYNLRGYSIANPGGKISDIKINPAGYSFALISGNDKKRKVTVHAVNDPNNKREIQGLIFPSAICYSADSRNLMIADDGKIKIFDSKILSPLGEFSTGVSENPTDMTVSKNGYFLAATYPDKVNIYNISGESLRTSIPFNKAASIAFTDTSEAFGILSEDGNLTVYSTVDFTPTNIYNQLASTSGSLFFHPAGNYAGFVADGDRIQFVNLYESADRPVIYGNDLRDARFVKDGRQTLYLADISGTDIRYRELTGFATNYNFVMNEKLNAMMAEWSKMRPGETEAEYRARVNEESMRQQRILFSREIATEMALTSGLGSFSDITLGRYNPSDGTLIVSISGYPDIFLKVPVEDMPTFGDGNNLQFSNPVYALTPANTFDLLYVDVFNPTNGKYYVFDNLVGQDLSLLGTNDDFVSLDIIMQSSREDLILQSIKDRILNEARDSQRLSEHTSAHVNSEPILTTDPSGRRIINYRVNFSYEVDSIGTATEDFAPGKYRISESNAAESMLQMIRQAFLDEFATYIRPGKELIITITGSADGLPINGRIAYDGSLGEFIDEPCTVNGQLTSITVTTDKGITSNEQLGFMRATAVKDKLCEIIPELENMKVSYRNNINVAEEKGAQFRRINVSLEFVDAF